MTTIRIVYIDGSESILENFSVGIRSDTEYILESDDKKILHYVSKRNILFMNVTQT